MTMDVDFNGAEWCPSPNFGERRDIEAPDILVLHYTAMETSQAACDWLCSEEAEVSAHYLIAEDGHIQQLVREQNRAWHAGVSSWQGHTDINSRSIGIEIANMGHEAGCPDYPSEQLVSVIALCQSILERYDISPKNVVAHSDIAPLRKRDPGEWFPWAQLYEAGIGHYIKPVPVSGGRYFMRGEEGQPIEALQSMLSLYGYGLEITGQFDDVTEAVVTAFQRHFRPEQVDGIADMSTIETLHQLLSSQ